MSFTIRPFTDADYEAMARVHNSAYPDYPETAADWRRWNKLKESKINWGYFVAEKDGEIVGMANYSNSSWAYHPRKFVMLVAVQPEARGDGIGAALYDKILAAVAEHDAVLVRSEVREDMEFERKWTTERGFVVDQREQESILKFEKFDPSQYGADLKRVEEQGIRIVSYADLANDPDRNRRYHDMDMEIAADVPNPDGFTPAEYDVWCKRMFESPNFLPELNLIAVDGDRYIGISNFWRTETEGRAETGLTGIRREYRKRGLATALKIKALTAAKEAGYDHTMTWNEEHNKGMLGINLRLGFEFRPAWLEIKCVLDAAALAEIDAAEEKSKASA
ncbi:MAG: GNAT family N-acetyltransferase [bacterium]|nr:GNAT family N-acetyltransferase [bacterium]